jgi:putative ABC transport system permease protein
MLLLTVFRVALRSLAANKLRMVLTMLGVIMGVAAVIAMLAIGEGAQAETLNRFEQMGSNLLILGNDRGRARRQQLTETEWRAIAELSEYVDSTAPEANANLKARQENRSADARIIGTTPAYFSVRNVPLASGRPFTEEEVARAADVCVLGWSVAQDLFQGEEAVNRVIYLGPRRTTVVGVAEEKGTGWSSQDTMVMSPHTTVMNRLSGNDHFDRIHISCATHEIVGEAQAMITDLLRRRRGLTPEEENNFRFFAVSELIDQIEQSTAIFKALLGGVAAVSLLVGGIGIMNIMLVTVTERTREIGIRKALGARRRDIMLQFLIESVVVACVGGGLGIALGWGVSELFDRFVEAFNTLITPDSIILAASCSTAIGLVFGVYPARRAALLDPIEALRYE